MTTKKKPKTKKKTPKREFDLMLRINSLKKVIEDSEINTKLQQQHFDHTQQRTEVRIFNLREYIVVLEQENHNLMEAIKGLGEVLGQTKTKNQKLEAEYNYITPKNTLNYENNQKQEDNF